jgi:hypothetical protein
VCQHFLAWYNWKSCHFKNPSRRAAHLAQQVNKKLHPFFPAGLRGTCLVFFFYIVINCFGSVLAAIA